MLAQLMQSGLWPVVVGASGAVLVGLLILVSTRVWRAVPAVSLLPGWELALKCLTEGNPPSAALDFVAEWGPETVKGVFKEAALHHRQGAPLSAVLETLAKQEFHPRAELIRATLVAAERSPEAVQWTCQLIAVRSDQLQTCRSDVDYVISGSRSWVIGLVIAGLLLASMLIIAIPNYSTALLTTGVGQGVLAALVGLELAGVLWAGLIFRIHQRLLGSVERR